MITFSLLLLLSLADDVWKIHRKSLNYSFNLKILQTFIPIFIENSQSLVNDLAVNLGKKKEFDMLHYTTKCALNMICGKYKILIKMTRNEAHKFYRHVVWIGH